MTVAELLAKAEVWPHKKHQLEAVEHLVRDVDPARGRVIPNVFALFDEVGAGKTKEVVDSAQLLFYGCPPVVKPRTVDTMLAIVPGFARSTWADEDPLLGEVAKHAWPFVPNVVHEFHGSYDELDFSEDALHWVVTNYEFIRRDARRDALLEQLKGRRTWMVLDESWCVKGNSDQTRACLMIRNKRADRVTILNGTPLADGKPDDLYYQFLMLDRGIIGAKTRGHFRSKYCVLGGFNGKTIVDYQNLDELNKRVAPYVRSVRTRDCFDLPPMMPPLTVDARLTDPTWKIYRAMRDDMAAFLAKEVSVSKVAITKALRLSQICAGFLGGLEEVQPDDTTGLDADQQAAAPLPDWLRKLSGDDFVIPPVVPKPGPNVPTAPVQKLTREIGSEKLSAFLSWLDGLGAKPHKLLVWCRFKPELERVVRELSKRYPTVLTLRGGQTLDERAVVKRLLAPGGDPRPGAVVGIVGTGAASLNFSAAALMVFLSHDPALIKRTQSIGRIERPGQTSPMVLVDFVATGPKGQRTYDHHALKALRGKDDMSKWTVNEWRKILGDD